MQDTPATLKAYQTYIDGKWTGAASGKSFPTYDPYTGEPWALIPECDKADVDLAVEAASRAFESGPWPAMTQTARGKIMRRIAQLIEQHGEHLARIEVRDNGKLISEMAAQTKYMPEWFYYYGGLADKIQGAVVPVDRPEHFNYILKEPVGVCAFIMPWNSPLMLATWKLAPALAAGCTVVIKPSEYTSASLLEFMKLVIAESGLPPGVVNVVTGYGAAAGEPLVTHPKVAKVAFHRRQRNRRARQRAGGQEFQESLARTGWQIAEYRLRRRHSRRCRDRRDLGHLRGNRPDLHRRLAAPLAGDHPR